MATFTGTQQLPPKSPIVFQMSGSIGNSMMAPNKGGRGEDYKTKWIESQKDSNSSTARPFLATDPLFTSMMDEVKKAIMTGDDTRKVVVRDLDSFLYDVEKHKGTVDSCIRWMILYHAAEKLPVAPPDSILESFEDEALREVVKIIAEREPHLSFEDPNHDWRNVGSKALKHTIKGQCKKKDHWNVDKKRTTPFHRAASQGNFIVIPVMISSLKLHCEKLANVEPLKRHPLFRPPHKDPPIQLITHVLSSEEYERRSTALKLVTWDAVVTPAMLKTLTELLEYPEIAFDPDTTFTDSLSAGKVNVVEEFLKKPKLAQKFVTAENIIKALDARPRVHPIEMDSSSSAGDAEEYDHDAPTGARPGSPPSWHGEAPSHRRELGDGDSAKDDDEDIEGDGQPPDQQENVVDGPTEILRILLRYAEKDDYTPGVIHKIVQLDAMDIWEMVSDQELDTSWLLHLAVSHHNLQFVKHFIKKYPESVISKAQVHDPLWPHAVLKPPPKTTGVGNDAASQNTEEESTEKHYPLWYNNSIRKPSSGWTKRTADDPEPHAGIRRELVMETIKRTETMQKLLEILEGSEERIKELCFELSQFNSKSHRVRDFAHSLILHQEHQDLLSYEETIKYARFPALDIHSDNTNTIALPIRDEHTEVFDILDWLYQTKHVRTILELKVLDRLINPHNELDIAQYVEDFGVEVLDWRFLDMSVSVLKEGTKKRLRGLHLYSSGKRAAISHWLNKEDGLPSKAFENLQFVWIHVIQDLMTKEQCTATRSYIKNKLKDFKKKDWVVPSARPWNPTSERLPSLEDIAQRAFPKLSRFILSYRDYATGSTIPKDKKAGHRPTKVAIIDNGIMSMTPAPPNAIPGSKPRRPGTRTREVKGAGESTSKTKDGTTTGRSRSGNQSGTIPDTASKPNDDEGQADGDKRPRTLWSRVQRGRSFVDDEGQVSPWMFASDPHGTQMANLICAIDPLCEIYVAKVTDSNKYGITPQRVAKAITWATDNDVDIISMSFSMVETSPELDKAITRAFTKGIVMMCSNHDEGSVASKAYPASDELTHAIAACDEYGALLRETEDKYAYKVHALNIAAGSVPFLDSSERVSGSSVATAIASGLSSLILSCVRLNNPGWEQSLRSNVSNTKEDEKRYRHKLVTKYLDAMVVPDSKSYLSLEKFGNMNVRFKDGEHMNAQTILEDAFKRHYVDLATEGKDLKFGG
ncbi:hypothetical protein B0T16DRAFT_460740 [Cercophora newfieldiana]|uniref:Peptidase S8/S53 domain-containing protein n=1 Tax=Cercophora newfieldiana TaxID=92897 RepID=A0AA40CJD2_9PEZI|nr:hypothetical protein B0T16DRAFT_460740 [Cercophora newfieldiana]